MARPLFSSPLDEAYSWSAIRYVERKPLRAGIVEKAENYLWPSAAAHCGLINTPLLAPIAKESPIPTNEWSSWLAIADNDELIAVLRRNVEKGLPCGGDIFIEKLESLAHRALRYRPQGRPFSK